MWDEAIKNRLKHVRKYDAKKRRQSLPDSGIASAVKEDKCTKVKRAKRSDFWNEIPVVSKENEVVIGEHVAELKKECDRPPQRRDVGKVKQLMTSTFEYRRSEILTNPIPAEEILQKYPPLQTVSGVRFYCLMLTSSVHVKVQVHCPLPKQ